MATDPFTPATSPTVDLSGLPEQIAQSINQLVDSIREKLPSSDPSGPRRPLLRSKFADLKLSFPADDIDEARREAWAAFPRDFPDAREP